MPDEPKQTGTEIPADHWVNQETDAELITPEAKQALSKYETKEAAIVGGLKAQRMVGRPFKMPEKLEDVDKWPDQKDRDGFRNGLNKLLGAVEKPEDLKDFNFAEGMAEGGKANEEIAGEFSKFIVESKMPKALAQKAVKFYNEMGVKFMQRQEAIFLENAKKADNALIADPNIGSAEKLAETDELVRRMFQNNLGLNADEYEQAAVELVSANFTQNIVLRKALHAAARQLAKEGTTEVGAGGGKSKVTVSKYEENKARWPNTPDLWGKREE